MRYIVEYLNIFLEFQERYFDDFTRYLCKGLLATDVSTTFAEARVFQNPTERFDWSINRAAVGKRVMWL